MTTWYHFLTTKNEDLFVAADQIVSVKSNIGDTSIVSLTSGQWYEVHWAAKDIIEKTLDFQKELKNNESRSY